MGKISHLVPTFYRTLFVARLSTAVDVYIESTIATYTFSVWCFSLLVYIAHYISWY